MIGRNRPSSLGVAVIDTYLDAARRAPWMPHTLSARGAASFRRRHRAKVKLLSRALENSEPMWRELWNAVYLECPNGTRWAEGERPSWFAVNSWAFGARHNESRIELIEFLEQLRERFALRTENWGFGSGEQETQLLEVAPIKPDRPDLTPRHRQIVHALRERTMQAKQLAQKLNTKPSLLKRHLRELTALGYIRNRPSEGYWLVIERVAWLFEPSVE